LADEVFICNAVRGLVRVKVEFPMSTKNNDVPSQEVEHAPLLVGED
jgi:branched-subunit amino acid aminotransferase/4-amino-4-deoxychorismate lyase